MTTRKFQSPYLYLASFVIGTLIFISGFLITNQIIYRQEAAVLEKNLNDFYLLFELGIESDLFSKDVCSINFTEKAEQSFYYHRKLITDLEETLGKEDKRVLLQKKIYNIAQAQHYLLKSAQNQKCGKDYTLVLFFYSNEGENLKSSEKIGSMLDSIVYNNPNIIVYAFDTSTQNEFVNKLMDKYSVLTIPSIVVNGRTHSNLTNVNDINFLLK
ncbi:MAG: hypothetical protein WCI72_00320 [archaeon]